MKATIDARVGNPKRAYRDYVLFDQFCYALQFIRETNVTLACGSYGLS